MSRSISRIKELERTFAFVFKIYVSCRNSADLSKAVKWNVFVGNPLAFRL